MGASSRNRLLALFAGLFALAMALVPAQHASAVLARAMFVASYAMPHGTLPELCADGHASADDHGQHILAPACMACVVMAAPGLANPPAVLVVRVSPSATAGFHAECSRTVLPSVWAPSRARAPPAQSIA
jgi:hypothetical protein